jgi:hypothetical protein
VADVIVYVEEMTRQAARLDEQARKVRDYHAAWKTSTAFSTMGGALPEPKSAAEYAKTIATIDRQLTLLATVIQSWADGFRGAARVYRDSDVLGARAISGVLPAGAP